MALWVFSETVNRSENWWACWGKKFKSLSEKMYWRSYSNYKYWYISWICFLQATSWAKPHSRAGRELWSIRSVRFWKLLYMHVPFHVVLKIPCNFIIWNNSTDHDLHPTMHIISCFKAEHLWKSQAAHGACKAHFSAALIRPTCWSHTARSLGIFCIYIKVHNIIVQTPKKAKIRQDLYFNGCNLAIKPSQQSGQSLST